MRKLFNVNCRGHKLSLGKKTCLMAVLNVTPDSFSDAGLFYKTNDALKRGLQMAQEGADIIDIGGESTRPGAKSVSADKQIARILPVIKGLAEKISIPLSVDTTDALVAETALKAGAAIINDISGLRFDKNLAGVIAKYKAGCIVMHMKGTPRTMQSSPKYSNLMKEICSSLKESIEIAKCAGINENRIIVDPGIGFGKTISHNLKILKNLAVLDILKRPILVGTSRKSFIGKILNLPVNQRLLGTAASSAIAIANGAHIIRVHDVKEMAEVVCLTDAIFNEV